MQRLAAAALCIIHQAAIWLSQAFKAGPSPRLGLQANATLLLVRLMVGWAAQLGQQRSATIARLLGKEYGQYCSQLGEAKAAVLREAEAACQQGIELVQRLPGAESGVLAALRQLADKIPALKEVGHGGSAA